MSPCKNESAYLSIMLLAPDSTRNWATSRWPFVDHATPPKIGQLQCALDEQLRAEAMFHRGAASKRSSIFSCRQFSLTISRLNRTTLNPGNSGPGSRKDEDNHLLAHGTSIYIYKTKPPVFMAKINKNSDNFTLMLDGRCIQKCLSNICLTLELIGLRAN